ncbi:hypothetical protein EW145_g5540 [Phellinidium pouzarii]|uniref:ERCC1-like central domain-containing protein n=1 Tax=Phellinidium pouzarii TaxID=167371 RepID=A0A4S4KZK8_9AGAM|nr:hypothetical protein EW145_g5540 [Phellinidium pouzarii]
MQSSSIPRLNPILECIRNVSKEFGDIVPDFQLGRTTGALFLSLKYHRLHPEYIHQRIQKLGITYNLRILLLMCDVSEHQDPIRELTKICLINNITVMVCWSNEEAGMYLTTYKMFEHKSPDLIKERVDKEYGAMLRSALTSINKVNKMDVETLRTSFGSFNKIAHASPDQLRSLPGFGQVKVRRVVDAFEKPFRNKATSAIPTSHVSASVGDQDEQELLALERQHEQPVALNASQSLPTQIRRVHEFGSAADMPPPPPPAAPRTSARAPSPPWNIELDLNEGDLKEAPLLADPRLVKKGGARSESEGITAATEKSDEIEVMKDKRREKPPSPIWDIELDLNDDG